MSNPNLTLDDIGRTLAEIRDLLEQQKVLMEAAIQSARADREESLRCQEMALAQQNEALAGQKLSIETQLRSARHYRIVVRIYGAVILVVVLLMAYASHMI